MQPPTPDPPKSKPKQRRRIRSAHSAADEKRIDTLQALVTERVERGAAVGVHRCAAGYRVIVFNARGDEALTIERESKSGALDDTIWELRHIGVGALSNKRIDARRRRIQRDGEEEAVIHETKESPRE